MSTAYGKIPKPEAAVSIDAILPITKKLKNGKNAYLQAIDTTNQPLVTHLQALFNQAIEDGSTYPQEYPLGEQQFMDYFLGYDAFVLATEIIDRNKDYDFDNVVIGMYYVKPNYPGRCSHICNAGFITSISFRGQGGGMAMGETLLTTAPALGYKASVFNLVFVNNEASIRIWRKLGFQEVGRIPQAGRLKNSPDQLVDALIFYNDFSKNNALPK
ncbi:uncharacterized protein BYT42DRAFT_544819 [Radiomyces spectabilis]|uniref:uncharacterized protein n=1 Tax=Radiomyces spectabilis TaxID=64574 RepID=UPI00221EF7D6|nr:uncharacterized protein BYT42DRAFT_544819 [Radiomyces spectabilis]KAI8385020.1 hypothetical protein BYT42DRAFT_544819 [Radiomyces spectabilis]